MSTQKERMKYLDKEKTPMECADCNETNAYNDWEFLEGVELCCDCANIRLRNVAAPPGYEIDAD